MIFVNITNYSDETTNASQRGLRPRMTVTLAPSTRTRQGPWQRTISNTKFVKFCIHNPKKATLTGNTVTIQICAIFFASKVLTSPSRDTNTDIKLSLWLGYIHSLLFDAARYIRTQRRLVPTANQREESGKNDQDETTNVGHIRGRVSRPLARKAR